MRVRLAPVTDFAALGARWRALEARADASFFQSWSWTGCLAAERFPDPLLLTVEDDGATVALALFNRRRGRLGRETLFLGESGEAGRDSPFIEHNGPLIARGLEGRALPAFLDAALRAPAAGRRGWGRALVLSGVAPGLEMALRAAGAVIRVQAARPAPFLALAGPPLMARVSANTRQQIRRSQRLYAATGPLTLTRAETVPQALEFLEDMATLHQAAWRARGQPGAFARPFFGRFHRELIARALPRGECDLLRIAAGGRVAGFLYNYVFGRRVLAYQSGFDYAGAPAGAKPGLLSHALAIAAAQEQGHEIYDFLGGSDRTKRSLSGASTPLLWLAAAPRGGLAGGLLAARNRLSEALRRRSRGAD